MVIYWSPKAQIELRKIYEHIKIGSIQNAKKVRNEIAGRCNALSQNPERYPTDKYKRNNKGQDRAFKLYHYRISYKIMEDIILIVRIRHTSLSLLNTIRLSYLQILTTITGLSH